MLILGGFTSVPGAIVGGLIIGVGEKLGEFYWGPLRRRRHRELARLCHRARPSCCSGRRACSAKRSSSGSRRMLYREAGQYKTSYAADMAMFPIRAGPHRPGAHPGRRLRRHPARRQRLPPRRRHDPVPGLLARRDRAQPAHRLCRPALARHRRRSWGSAPTPATSSRPLFPGVNILVWILASGSVLGGGRRAVRPAVAAHQGLLPRGRDARGAVLPAMVLHPRPLALQLQRLGRDRGADAHAVRRALTGPTAIAGGALLRGARHRRAADLARLESRARPHRPRPGWRCATWTSRPS